MAFLWIAILGCSIGVISCGSYDSLIVNEHNRYRRMENAANMQEMVWSTKVENAATSWANKCTQSHQSAGYGENLYMYTANQPDSNLIKEGIKAWYDEKSLWSWGAGFSGATGHYTQVVWAETNQVGCGVKICPPSGFFTRNWLYLVCFYLPPGNMMGENPYQLGGVCTKCKAGQQCNNGLCSGGTTGDGGSTGGGSTGGGGTTGGGTGGGNDNNGNTWDDNNNGWDDNGWDNNGWDNNGWDNNGWDNNGWDNNGWDNNGWDNNGWYDNWYKRHQSRGLHVVKPVKGNPETPVLVSRGHSNRLLQTQKDKLHNLFNILKKNRIENVVKSKK